VRGQGERRRDDAAFEATLAGAAGVAQLLWERGWAERNAGNLSCDVTGFAPPRLTADSPTTPLGAAFPELSGRHVFVTAAGSRMRDVAREPELWCGVLRVSDDGAAYRVAWHGREGSAFVPTSELPSHLAIHAALRRRGAPPRAVVHTHPPELLALSLEPGADDQARFDRLLWSLHPETVVVVPAGVAVVPYVMPGTVEQGVAAGRAMETHDVALWLKHGAVAVGADFAAAFDLIDTVNKAARLYLLCRSAGIVPEGLSGAQVEELRRAYGARPAS
jgi:rhamnulose-1-phosphate aldolase